MFGRILVLSLAVMIVTAGCAGTPAPTEDVTLSYQKVFQGSGSAARQVGWLEIRGHEDPDGMRSIVSFVMDMDHYLHGHITSEGQAIKYEDVAPLVAHAIDVKRRYHKLPVASRQHHIRLILGLPIDAEVHWEEASVSDVRKAK